MINETTSVIRRSIWFVSIGVAFAGFLIAVGTDLDSSNWSQLFVLGVLIFFAGGVLAVVLNDPICAIAKLATLYIIIVGSLYSRHKIRTNRSGKCFEIYTLYHMESKCICCAAYEAIYAIHPIESIIEF